MGLAERWRSKKGWDPPEDDERKEGTTKMRGVRHTIRGGEVEKARVRR